MNLYLKCHRNNSVNFILNKKLNIGYLVPSQTFSKIVITHIKHENY